MTSKYNGLQKLGRGKWSRNNTCTRMCCWVDQRNCLVLCNTHSFVLPDTEVGNHESRIRKHIAWPKPRHLETPKVLIFLPPTIYERWSFLQEDHVVWTLFSSLLLLSRHIYEMAAVVMGISWESGSHALSYISID